MKCKRVGGEELTVRVGVIAGVGPAAGVRVGEMAQAEIFIMGREKPFLVEGHADVIVGNIQQAENQAAAQQRNQAQQGKILVPGR